MSAQKKRLDYLLWPGAALVVLAMTWFMLHFTPLALMWELAWAPLNVLLGLAGAGILLATLGLVFRITIVRVLLVILLWIGVTLFISRTAMLFSEQDIRITNHTGKLAGTLLIPRQPTKSPLVVLVHGSFPSVRSGYRAFAQLLVNEGIPVFIYDKRGHGQSSGSLPYRYAKLSQDLGRVMDYLKRNVYFSANGIGIIGFSEGGGYVAPAAVADNDSADFLVVISGGVIKPYETVLFEMVQRLEQARLPQNQIYRAVEMQQRANHYFRTHDGLAEANHLLQALKEEVWFKSAFGTEASEFPDSIDRIHFSADYPHYLDFDPTMALGRIVKPVLFIFGDKDRQLPVKNSIDVINAISDSNESTHFEVVRFANADHLIMENHRLAEGYFSTLTQWISNVGKSINLQ